ncbi:GreA/GreB family elongation factor [Allosphingosinicella flava]|uniref:GreA/GreB family elongation factor n=1 Tax=Allosphingosinicella flava TaxID=2771430 RepID=A0A7T2GI66_9SPHN|nr:GreA/GreB family elongation factor [Sphingosinicella flava]QPQ54345.1 GreA/GreB family elongation factor [Sphingosinicella flava]
MSVAFRRESDEEHKEPRFEIPIPVGPNLVTPNGLAQIETRVAELEARIASDQDAAGLEETKRDLRYWRTRLATAQVAPPPPEGEVGFGSRVRLRHDGAVRDIAIVGDDEADPSAGLISFSAPLARAVMGAFAGEYVDFAGKAEAIEIVEIGAI